MIGANLQGQTTPLGPERKAITRFSGSGVACAVAALVVRAGFVRLRGRAVG